MDNAKREELERIKGKLKAKIEETGKRLAEVEAELLRTGARSSKSAARG